MVFKFNVCGDKLKFLNEREAYSGNTNYRCNFLLSDEWNGLESFAVFIAGEKAVEQVIVDGECKIPYEALEHGEFTVGAFATNGSDGSEEELIRISTNLIHIEVYEGAFREAGIAEEDEPTIWEQYVQLCAAEREAAESAKQVAESARDEAEGFAKEAKDAKEGIGNIAKDVEQAKADTLTYRNEAFTSKGMAAISAGDAERYKNAAANEKTAAMEAKELAETARDNAKAAQKGAEDARDLAKSYKNEAFANKETAKNYANTAQREALKAEQAKQDILNAGESFVSKDKDEEISGVKTFSGGIKTDSISTDLQLEMNGDGAVISGGSSGVYLKSNMGIYANDSKVATEGDIKKAIEGIELPTIDERNLVHKTGDEDIAGNKKFTGNLDIKQISTEEQFKINAVGGARVFADSDVTLEGVGAYLYLWNGAEFSLAGDMTVNGKVVALKEDITKALENITPPAIDESNLVHKDKAETITGKKTFDAIDANTISAAKNRLALIADAGVTINGKMAATTDDITTAIQEAILDSWSEVIEP